MFFHILSLALFFLFSSYARPELSPREARSKINEILKAHVRYDSLSPDLIARTFHNFLEELDHGKTYLLEGEVAKWIHPSDELLESTLYNMQRENYSNFEEIHAVFCLATARRNKFESQLDDPSQKKVEKSLSLKNLDWAKTEQELFDRIKTIYTLQIQASEKLDDDMQQLFRRRFQKWRIKKEEKLTPPSQKERQKLILSLVLKSVSSALDSQTTYFTPAEANQFMIQVQQRLFGIGALLRDDLTGFSIIRLIEGGPAKEEGKLHIGDRIIAVDGQPVVGMDIVEAVERIRGPKGTKAILTVLRHHEEREETLHIEITRREVVLTETRFDKSFEPYGDGVIGILHLHSFYQDSQTSSAEDLRGAIAEIKRSHKLKGIVLDLRNNAGGLLPQAVAVTGLFIKKGIVVSVKDNTGKVQHLRNIDSRIEWDGPLVVLTSRTSASAAEIVAQTLQDYQRAIIVGDPSTYGKGTFQTFTLESSNYGKINPKGEFKVTRGCYYTVSGKSPQLVGVIPNVIVPGIYSELKIGERFSKYPLENETIPPNFEDNLSDVPPAHKKQIIRLYKFDLQKVLPTYQPYLPTLIENSKMRIEQNAQYQNFIAEISSEETLSETAEKYSLSDFQRIEAVSILKDLIFLVERDEQLENKPFSAA